jgi:hypothetical protein
LEPRLDGTTRLPDCLRDVIVCHVLELRQDSVTSLEQVPQKIGLFHDANLAAVRLLKTARGTAPVRQMLFLVKLEDHDGNERRSAKTGEHLYRVARGSTTATGGDSSIRSSTTIPTLLPSITARLPTKRGSEKVCAPMPLKVVPEGERSSTAYTKSMGREHACEPGSSNPPS